MKADKILFGAVCVGMGFMLHSVANKSGESFSCKHDNKAVPETVYVDSCKLKQPLLKDTLQLSVKSDSLRALKKIVK